MCGIAGYAGFDDETLLRAMCAKIAHRGPDDEGVLVFPGAGLGIRRLAIIDLETGRQPIANESGTVWAVLNGEIYNYEELRAELIARGHRLTTRSDTETIVHLYEEHGPDFVAHLRGMFAIAVWDASERRLTLVRDRIGEKPLFYQHHAGRLLFGSEIKTLLSGTGGREPDPQALCEFLALGYVPNGRTAFRGIHKLPPAHRLTFSAAGLSVEPYWRRSATPVAGSVRESTMALRGLLEETVRLCLRSDVEVGAFLSGGLDSSLLVALMRRQAAQVQTFTVGYDGAAAGFNELTEARQVAQRLGTTHHELRLGPSSSVELLPTLVAHYDEPHGEPTSALVYQLSAFARAHVKVAIGGTGGDEGFFGYPRHRGLRMLGLYQQLPFAIRRLVIERMVARFPESTRGSRFAKRVKRFVEGADASPAAAYRSWVRLLSPEVHSAVIASPVRAAADDPSGDQFLREHLEGSGEHDLLVAAAAIDVDGYLPEYQLAYMDRMSMAHGLEVRSPLCDYRLLEFALALPTSFRLRRFRSKHLLKAAAAAWLPSSTVNRSKVGFDSPVGQWFKHELRPFITSFLAPDQLARSGLLNPQGVQQLLAAHLSGRRDYSLQLWSLLVVEVWYRMYIEGGYEGAGACRLQDLRGATRAG